LDYDSLRNTYGSPSPRNTPPTRTPNAGVGVGTVGTSPSNTTSDFKKYSFKMDMCRFAYTTYEKTLIELRNHAQTGVDEYQMNSFLIKMQTIDDTVTDITPPTRESYIRDYTKKFRHNAIKAETHSCES